MPTVKEVLAKGWQLHQAGKLDKAEACYRAVAQQVPDNATAWCYLGILHFDRRQYEESERSYLQAIARQEQFPIAWGNLGNTLVELGRFDEGIAAIERALQQKPSYQTAMRNLVSAHFRVGNFDHAYETLQHAIAHYPDDARFRMNFGILELLRGNFSTGWDEYEWRFGTEDVSLPRCAQPYWDGSPLAGRSILLASEQGLGDAIQFIRFAPLLRQHGAGRVVVRIPQVLLSLLRDFEGAHELVGSRQATPATDVFVPMMSVPRLLQLHNEADFHADHPYIRAEPDRVRRWAGRLDPGCFNVAVAWRGNPKHPSDSYRSAGLRALSPLAAVPGVRLISIQKPSGDPTAHQAELREAPFDITEFGDELDADAPFLDTAAIMTAADLVVTIDTSIAHLGGALGVPVWVALSKAPDWRWQLNREDTPWYPSLRLFRQAEMGNWSTVFAAMAKELLARTAAPDKPPCGSIRIDVSPGELIDKLTILEIKQARLTEPAAQANVRRELHLLNTARRNRLNESPELARLERALKDVNEALWQIEDDIRQCEREGRFGADFVELARSVYRRNDERSALKQQINALLGSALVEEKSYQAY